MRAFAILGKEAALAISQSCDLGGEVFWGTHKRIIGSFKSCRQGSITQKKVIKCISFANVASSTFITVLTAMACSGMPLNFLLRTSSTHLHVPCEQAH
jgi:hypothetical protein